MAEFRCEITLSESHYRGDRDERLTTFTVSGEGDTTEKAIRNAINNMGKLGHEVPPPELVDWSKSPEGGF